MNSPARPGEFTAHASITIGADPEIVWRFLSEPERFGAWIGAYAGAPPLPGTSIDPRVGGKVRVQYPGDGMFASGEFVEIDPPNRVVLTWGYEHGSHGIGPGESRIEITLTPVANGTRVDLRHSGLPDDDAARGASGGWTHYLTMMARQAAAAQYEPNLAQSVDAYFAAWSEPDAGNRRALLDTCCEADVAMRGAFAMTSGVDALSSHIAGALMHMPNMRLTADGAPQQMHGFARFRWTVNTPDGKVVMRGANFARLSRTGQFMEIVSFGDGG
ncbi:MAG: SRPBCC domain-containing protein [Phycisphaerales bacterium]|nr:SRPBCC domain-containing protein [Phycisphaerales bacterium]